MRVVSVKTELTVINKILSHLAKKERAPPKGKPVA